MTKLSFVDLKNWNIGIENKVSEEWRKAEKYNFKKSSKKIYSIDTPPPYVNAPIHIGHATTYCYMDFFARYKRMKGFSVIFPLGLDRNGLPIEMAAEKKYGVSPFKVGREKFIEYCEKLLNETSEESTDSFSKLGISFSSYKEGESIGSVYKTDSEEYRKVTQATFIELYKKGLIYEDKRINNWDPKLQTTLADSEIEYKEISSSFNHVKWKVKETGEELIIATTRPELICTCGMVIYHPDDKKYKHLEGKTAISPIFGKEVPIKSHNLADPEKGSGIVMMCSAGDLSDIQFFREMGLKPEIAIEKDGKMNDIAGSLSGMKVKEAREKIIEMLNEEGVIVKSEKINHRTPVSERSGAEIEFIEMDEFYLKQLDFKDDLRKVSEKINFYPGKSKKILDDWLDSVSIDWPISRRRYYATSVPIWKSENGKYLALPKAGDYYVPWKSKVPGDAEVFENGRSTGKKAKDFDFDWVGETRVFDTWMDSSISELFILGYLRDDSFFKKNYPASLRPQGKEIVRTWLYYTLLRGYLETGKPAFDDVWIHQHILDSKGRKMSKSLGNVVDPKDLLEKYGAEAFRFWAAIEGNLANQDLKCSEIKIQAEQKTMNKLLNVARFVSMFEKPKKKPKLLPADELFIDCIEDLTEFSEKCYEEYDFYQPTLKLREFLWDSLASSYLELVKGRAYNESEEFSKQESDAAKYTLYYLIERFLRLVYPVIPKISSVIGNGFGLSLLDDEFPKFKKGASDLKDLEKIKEFNSFVWKSKKDKGISLRDSIEGIEIPKDLKKYEKDLKICHKI